MWIKTNPNKETNHKKPTNKTLITGVKQQLHRKNDPKQTPGGQRQT